MVKCDISDVAYSSNWFAVKGANPVYLSYGSGLFGQGTGPIAMDNVQCIGTESRLVDCHSAVISCSHADDAGVRCLGRSGIQ